jgi:hypothetical protein
MEAIRNYNVPNFESVKKFNIKEPSQKFYESVKKVEKSKNKK